MSDDKALSLVGEINQAYNDLITSYRTSLTHALKLGDLLLKAKEAVGHGKWKLWLEANCPKISYRTAAVYMQLAKDREQFIDHPTNVQRAAHLGADGDLSIRDALNAVNLKDGGLGKKPRTPKPKEPAGQKPDLAETLKVVAPDEVAIAINEEWKPEQREELITTQLRKLPTDAIAKLLTTALDRAQLTEVLTHLGAYLKPPEPVRRSMVGAAPTARPQPTT